MELTQEINQLLSCCRDKKYIKTNLESLKSYFSQPQNINLLRFALTTNKNFSALKIVELLDLKIVPYIHINTFTFTSLFWLFKMDVVPEEEFQFLARKFRVLQNFDILSQETEVNFLKLQIEKRRRVYRRSFSNNTVAEVSIQERDQMVFVFYIDELFDIEKHIESFLDLKSSVFFTELKTFEEFPNDPERIIKQNRFKELKGRLMNCSVRNFTNFFVLDSEMQNKLEELMNALSIIRRCGLRYYICSNRPFSSILTFCYLYVNCIDLTKIIEAQTEEDLGIPVSGKLVAFGGPKNINFEFLSQTMENLTKHMKDYSLYS